MDIQWSLVLFSTLAGAGAWLFFFLGINEVKGGLKNEKTNIVTGVLSLVLLIGGGLFSVTHLSHPDRIMAALGHPTSGIFMEALFIGLTCIAIAVYLVMLKRGASASAVKVAAIIAAAIALMLTFVLGYSYIIPARPLWNTILLPIAYMGTAVSLGAAVYLLAIRIGREGKESVSFAASLLIVSGIAALALSLAYGFVSGAIGADHVLLLWIVVVVGSGLLPTICGFIAKNKVDQALVWSVIAIVGSLIGCIAFRCIMWLVGSGVKDFFSSLH